MSFVRRPAFLILVAAAALAAAAILFLRSRPSGQLRIAGRTIAEDGAPLAGVRITLEVAPAETEEEKAVERVETVSDERGNFAINFQGHWRGASYGLEARKPGYRTLSVDDAETLKGPVLLRLARSPS
ncbi:MAG TPA: carboxypeptidase-like regulatory domain-containing protein [Thermoanaerobaculia bacterium]|nr:carboxypeptidase-like regulatory domain-containing protein [Thermoanaerobaculia bacterium]